MLIFSEKNNLILNRIHKNIIYLRVVLSELGFELSRNLNEYFYQLMSMLIDDRDYCLFLKIYDFFFFFYFFL